MVSIGPFNVTRERFEFLQWVAVLCGVGLVLLLAGLWALNPRLRERLLRKNTAQASSEATP